MLSAELSSLVLLLLSLALILRRQIAKPLRQFCAATERIAAGDLRVRLETGETEDELGRVARAFNAMAHKVAERDAALRAERQELAAALESVRHTEQRFRALMEHDADFIAVLDAEGREL